MLTKTPRHGLAGGFTLIELLVGLAVGMIVLTGIVYSWSVAVRNNTYVLSVTALNNDLRSIMHLVTRDLRRATASNVDEETVEIGLGGSCVAFNAHMAPEDIPPEAIPSVADGTLVPSGYRLTAGRFQMWYSDADPPAESFGRCAENDPEWTSVMENGDRGVTITSFVVNTQNSRCLALDDPNIESAGRCADDATNRVELLLIDVTLEGSISLAGETRLFSFTDSIKIRNDRVLN